MVQRTAHTVGIDGYRPNPQRLSEAGVICIAIPRIFIENAKKFQWLRRLVSQPSVAEI